MVLLSCPPLLVILPLIMVSPACAVWIAEYSDTFLAFIAIMLSSLSFVWLNLECLQIFYPYQRTDSLTRHHIPLCLCCHLPPSSAGSLMQIPWNGITVFGNGTWKILFTLHVFLSFGRLRIPMYTGIPMDFKHSTGVTWPWPCRHLCPLWPRLRPPVLGCNTALLSDECIAELGREKAWWGLWLRGWLSSTPL